MGTPMPGVPPAPPMPNIRTYFQWISILAKLAITAHSLPRQIFFGLSLDLVLSFCDKFLISKNAMKIRKDPEIGILL